MFKGNLKKGLQRPNAFTNFHIDFGGTSVWFHMIMGKKIFFIIEPTYKNIQIYKSWCNLENRESINLASLVSKCYKIELFAGNTLIMPNGWIHSVYTEEDSIAFSGAFLHSFNIPSQLNSYKIDLEIYGDTLKDFKEHHFSAAVYYTKLLKNNQKSFSAKFIQDLYCLEKYLNQWQQDSVSLFLLP